MLTVQDSNAFSTTIYDLDQTFKLANSEYDDNENSGDVLSAWVKMRVNGFIFTEILDAYTVAATVRIYWDSLPTGGKKSSGTSMMTVKQNLVQLLEIEDQGQSSLEVETHVFITSDSTLATPGSNSNQSSANTNNDSGDGRTLGLDSTAFIGMIIGAAVFIILLAVAGQCAYHRRQNRKATPPVAVVAAVAASTEPQAVVATTEPQAVAASTEPQAIVPTTEPQA